jgi:fructokinase
LSLIIGEAFWDVFEDGSKFLGGSALNVAWNLHGLEGELHFVTRLGNDDLGHEMAYEMTSWGLDTHDLQFHDKLPTGVIKVLMDEEKKPTFISPSEIAFDHIEYLPSLEVIPDNTMMYHGSFVLRHADNKNTLRKLKEKGHPVFMDLNLRDPYWSNELIDEWARDLEILKLSDDEFVMMTKLEGLESEKQIEWLQKWMRKKSIQNVLFTMGSKGAHWLTQNENFFSHTQKINAVSTVGAGDAFCAGVLYSLGLGLSPRECIEKSSRFASEICMLQSATSQDHEFYTRCKSLIWGI